MLGLVSSQFWFWLATMLCVAAVPPLAIAALLCRFRLWMGLVAVVFVALALVWLRSFGPWPALLYMWKHWWWQELTVLGVAFGLTAWVVMARRRSGGLGSRA